MSFTGNEKHYKIVRSPKARQSDLDELFDNSFASKLASVATNKHTKNDQTEKKRRW